MSTERHLKILGGSASGFSNVSLEARELAYDTTNKILYIGVDGTKKGTNNTPLSSSIIEKDTLPEGSAIRSDKFYWITKDDEAGHTAGLYYYNRNHLSTTDEWIKIEVSNKIINDDTKAKTTTYSSDKIVKLLEQYQANFIGSFGTHALLLAYTGAKDNNDIAIVLKDEDHYDKCYRYRYVVTDTKSEWTPEYAISNGTVSGDETTITTVTEDSNIKVKFVDPSEGDVNKVWRVMANEDGTLKWSLSNLSDKQDVLTAEDGIAITDNKISLAETVDFGEWSATTE